MATTEWNDGDGLAGFDDELRRQRAAVGLGPNEVICLILGKMCVYDAVKNTCRNLTADEYRRYCEIKDRPLSESRREWKYTRRQIQEAIAYWENQLRTGGYRDR